MSAAPDLRQRLDAGLAALGQRLDEVAVERLLAYLDLLARWNATYNLTAVREPAAMVTRHLLDALAVRPFLVPGALADLGTGAGIPGIPIAIAEPDRRVLLVESAGKKARFLREAVRTLRLARVRVVEARAEDGPPEAVDAVIARALAPLPALAALAAPWLPAGGPLFALKGPGHDAEARGLPAGWRIDAVHPLAVPGLDADRVLVVLRKAPD